MLYERKHQNTQTKKVNCNIDCLQNLRKTERSLLENNYIQGKTCPCGQILGTILIHDFYTDNVVFSGSFLVCNTILCCSKQIFFKGT